MNLYKYRKRTLMPLDAFRKRFRAVLAEEGYESREDIVALVREIKREQAHGSPLNREKPGEKC